MNEPIRHVFQVEVFAARAQVAFAVEVDLRPVVQQRPHPDVELAFPVQQGPLQVLLDDQLRAQRLRKNELLDVFNVSTRIQPETEMFIKILTLKIKYVYV